MKKLLVLFFVITVVSFSCKKSSVLDVDIVIDNDITESTTWTSDNVYLIDGNVEVRENAILTIEAGTIIKFSKDGELDVGSSSYGTIIANGTASEPITFTSNVEIQSKGDYYGIWLFDGANNCEFEYCTFEYGGGYATDYGVMNLYSTNASFKNCTFKQSAGYGIYASDGGFDAFSANTFNENDNSPVFIYAGYVQTMGTGNIYDAGTTIDVESDDVDKTGTVIWKNQGIAYKILGNISVGSSSGTTLSFDPGTVLSFTKSSELTVGASALYGSIVAVGTSSEPIVFTSSAASPTNGDWYGIWFYDGTGGNTNFEYCEVSYGGGYLDDGNLNFWDILGVNVSISNSSFNNSAGYGIYVYSGQAEPAIGANVTYSGNTLGDYYVE